MPKIKGIDVPRIEILRAHIACTTPTAYETLFDNMVNTLEICQRALHEDDFPHLKQQIRDIFEE